jgi:hypothetical protein
METIKELADEIYRERVARARETPPAEKFFLGAQLFERACRIMASGIRHQFPEADDVQVDEILGERLELLRSLEDRRDRR